MARDEDIFRRLSKQTPLVKQKELQPLSPKDFTLTRNTISIPVVSSDKKRAKKEIRRSEPAVFSRERERMAESRRERERDVYSEPAYEREQRAYEEPPRKVRKETESLELPGKERRPPLRAQSPRPLKREKEQDLEFTESARPQRAYEPRPAKREEPENRVSVMNAAEREEKQTPLRHELKFYINYNDYVMLRSSLKSLISADTNSDSDNSYYVRSLYFDDIYDSALTEKIAGSDYRKKYRIRIYNFRDDNIKFEKKYKVGQYVGKKSISLTRGECDSIIAGNCSFLLGRDEELAKEIYLEMKNNLLRPKVIVDYVREAYVSQIENCRITFDKDLKTSIMLKDIFDADAPMMPMYDTGIMVLEVKFDKFLPVTIKRVLNTINAAERCAISKYVISRRFV